MVKTSCFQSRGPDSVPGQGIRIHMPCGMAKRVRKKEIVAFDCIMLLSSLTFITEPNAESSIRGQFSSVQSLSRVRLFVTPWTAASQGLPVHRSSLRLVSIKSMMPSSHLFLCYPLLLLPPVPPSIRVFSSESTLRMRSRSP